MTVSQRSRSTRSPDGLGSQIIGEWPDDRPFTVEAVVRDRPDLAEFPSVLVELAYEEFCRREESGDPVAPSEFVARFPEIEQPLRRVLLIDGYCKRSGVRDILLGGPWPEVGDELVGFRLFEQIGEGAESRVYLAHDLEVGGRTVVVKVGPGCHEAATLGKLDHPNIVPILSARRDPETNFGVLCMPYLGRATLDAVIGRLFTGDRNRSTGDLAEAVRVVAALPAGRTAPRPGEAFEVEVARVALGLSAALAHAHANGVVHSDIKPSNILFAPDGRPMLLDFNLARREGEAAARTGGTLAYMAPERLSAWPAADCEATAESDVYSLGVTLRELLTGVSPVSGIDLSDPILSARHLAALRSRPPDVFPTRLSKSHRRLCDLVLACLSSEPAARPRCDEIVRELDLPHGPAMAIGRFAQVHRRKAIATLLAGLGGAAVSWAWSANRPRAGASEWEDGLAAIEAGRFADGATAFESIVAAWPGEPIALAARGWCHLRSGDPRLAYPDLKAAAAARPDGAFDALFGYGILHLAEDAAAARRVYQEAIDKGHDSAAVRTGIAYCCLQLGYVDDARRHLETALRHDPRCGQAHHAFALVERKLALRDQRPPDLSYVRSALDLAPPSPGLFLDCASVLAAACEAGADEKAAALDCLRSAIAAGAEPAGAAAVVAGYHPPLKRDAAFRSLARAASRRPLAEEADLRLACVAPPVDDPRVLFAAPVAFAR